MNELVIVAPLMPFVIGTSFDTAGFPRHLTLVPPFLVSCSLEDLGAALKAAAIDIEPLHIEVVGQDLFGPERDVAVALVDPTSSIVNAHLRLVSALGRLGWVAIEPIYNGEGFRPHVTSDREGLVLPGEHFVVREIALVELLDQPVVRSIHSLSLSSEAPSSENATF